MQFNLNMQVFMYQNYKVNLVSNSVLQLINAVHDTHEL